QSGNLGIGGAFDGAEAEFHAQVQQELVTTRGDTFDQKLNGIGCAHLIRANLGPNSNEHLGGIGGAKGFVIRGRAASGRGWCRWLCDHWFWRCCWSSIGL